MHRGPRRSAGGRGFQFLEEIRLTDRRGIAEAQRGQGRARDHARCPRAARRRGDVRQRSPGRRPARPPRPRRSGHRRPPRRRPVSTSVRRWADGQRRGAGRAASAADARRLGRRRRRGHGREGARRSSARAEQLADARQPDAPRGGSQIEQRAGQLAADRPPLPGRVRMRRRAPAGRRPGAPGDSRWARPPRRAPRAAPRSRAARAYPVGPRDTRLDRRQEAVLIVGAEDQDRHAGGRLLEGLEEDVLRILVQPVARPRRSRSAPHPRRAAARARMIRPRTASITDHGARRLRRETVDVGMIAVRHEPATPTCSAWPIRRIDGEAQLRGGDVERERRLADRPWPDEQQRVRQSGRDHRRDLADRRPAGPGSGTRPSGYDDEEVLRCRPPARSRAAPLPRELGRRRPATRSGRSASAGVPPWPVPASGSAAAVTAGRRSLSAARPRTSADGRDAVSRGRLRRAGAPRPTPRPGPLPGGRPGGRPRRAGAERREPAAVNLRGRCRLAARWSPTAGGRLSGIGRRGRPRRADAAGPDARRRQPGRSLGRAAAVDSVAAASRGARRREHRLPGRADADAAAPAASAWSAGARCPGVVDRSPPASAALRALRRSRPRAAICGAEHLLDLRRNLAPLLGARLGRSWRITAARALVAPRLLRPSPAAAAVAAAAARRRGTLRLAVPIEAAPAVALAVDRGRISRPHAAAAAAPAARTTAP